MIDHGRDSRESLSLSKEALKSLLRHRQPPLAATLQGLPAAFALTGAKADERQALLVILTDRALTAGRVGQISIGDRNYDGHDFKAD